MNIIKKLFSRRKNKNTVTRIQNIVYGIKDPLGEKGYSRMELFNLVKDYDNKIVSGMQVLDCLEALSYNSYGNTLGLIVKIQTKFGGDSSYVGDYSYKVKSIKDINYVSPTKKFNSTMVFDDEQCIKEIVFIEG